MRGLPLSLLLSLAMTLAIEAAVFLLAGKRDRKDLLLVLAVNVLTNPVVVLSYWLITFYTSWNQAAAVAILEILAVLVEAWCYKRMGRTFARPLLFSLAANGISYGIGLLLQTRIQ